MREKQGDQNGNGCAHGSAGAPNGPARREGHTALGEIALRLGEATGCRIVLVTMVFNARQIVLAHYATAPLRDAALAMPLDFSICQHTIERGAPLLIPDTHDVPELEGNRAVKDFGVRAYAGAPIFVRDEIAATVCALDTVARVWSASDQAHLEAAAAAAARELIMDTPPPFDPAPPLPPQPQA